MPQRGSGDVKSVERRHSRSRQSDFDSRVRKIYLPASGSGRKPQPQAFLRSMIATRHQRRIGGADRLPQFIMQDRVFPELLGEDAFGQARNKYRIERAATSLFRSTDEHTSETARWWFDFQSR